MASTDPSVNPIITDAITQVNVKVLGESPAMAMGHLYQTMAQATGLAFQNAVAAQQQMTATAQAATVTGIQQLYSFDTISTAIADSTLQTSNLPQVLAGLQASIQSLIKQTGG